MKRFTKDFTIGFLSCLCLFLLIQNIHCGRTFSRLGFGDEKLDLPKDFKAMVSVGFHTGNDGSTVKDLTYETMDGKFRSVEYKDKPFQLEGSILWRKQE
jgi:hypothetical protein